MVIESRLVVRTAQLAIALSSLALVAGCGGEAKDPRFWDLGEGVRVCSGSHTVPGIDVSEFQGLVDWPRVKQAGKEFAIARVSYGTDRIDPYFGNNWPGIRSAGLIRGVYQYFRPQDDPDQQANLMFHELSLHGGLAADDLAPVMDIEETDGLPDSTIRARMTTWLDKVKSVTGRTPIIYTADFMSGAIGSGFGGYPLWVANYGVSCPLMPSGWGAWKMWQFSSVGSVPGVPSPAVDLDQFNGTLDELRAFAGGLPLAGLETSPVARNADGRLQVFMRGTTGSIYTRAQITAGGAGGWTAWADLGGRLTTQPVVGQNADGRLELFARGTNDEVYHAYQLTPGGAFSGWSTLGGQVSSAIGVGLNLQHELEIFVRASDGSVEHKWRQTDGVWSNWSRLGGRFTSNVAVGSNADGRLEIFARGTNNEVYHNRQEASGWSGWASLGGQITSDVAVGRNADGRLEIFARGADDAVHHAYQLTAGGNFSGWSTVGGQVSSDVSVALNSLGRLEIFARGSNDAVYHDMFHPRSGWIGWASLSGKAASAAVVESNADGRLEVFMVGQNGSLYHSWQETPEGAWSGWSDLGGRLTQL